MKMSICKKFLFSLLLFSALGYAVIAESASKDEELKKLPNLSSIELYQMGDSDLTVSITGRKLPAPEVSNSGNQTTIVFREAYWKDAGGVQTITVVPMTTNMTSEQVESDVVFSFMTERPLQLISTRGAAPSDSYTLRFKTTVQHQKLMEEPVVTHQPQTLRVPSGPFAINTPITLDLRDTELRDVFRMLGMQLKKNIIIDQSLLSVLVTMTLKNTPLSEAFNYLMKTYDISYEFVGKDTIVIGTVDGLSKIAGKEETRAYRIAYADPAAMMALLVNVTKIPSDRVVVDPRLRTLYVTSHAAKLEEVAIAIQKLDHPGRQVMLHARILQFTEGDALEVENTLNAVYDHWWFNYSRGRGTTGYVDDNRRGRNWVEPDSLANALLPDNTDLFTPMQGTWREFDAAFRALESKTNSKTLANPSVITIDGQEASISLTEDYPYISGRDDGGNATWSNITIGPILKMLPRVGRDGIVTLELALQTSDRVGESIGSTGERVPQTSKREVITNVRVRNGEPFVVGGLFREDRENSRYRIPIVGQLPLLGELFTYRVRNSRKTQVVMVVIPYIVDTPDVAVDQERVMLRQ